MERESITSLKIAMQVINKEEFEDIYFSDSFVAKLMLDKFKKFLDDNSFEDFERQLVLRAFLQNNYPMYITDDIVSYIHNESILSDDYTKVLLEWNYEASDFITATKLAEFDGECLCMNLEQKARFDKIVENHQNELMQKTINMIQEVRKEDNGKKEN